ncbi:MAG TPA: LamG domain-containing protein, partial [Candidatus Dojkabacteria bacterium]|nr:LamG domain-containing protein [Candidatus Dojkabacteria bacterium]
FSDFTKGLTISLWANPTSNSNWGRFVDFGEPSGSAFSNIQLNRISTSNDLGMSIGNGSTYLSVTAPNGIINNEWHLYTGTVSESGMCRIYRDWILLSEAQLVVPVNVSRTHNYIGKSNYPADSLYQGYMDEVKIYNTAKTQDEIQRMYNEGLEYRSNRIGSIVNDGLISYWNMDETSGTSVKDSIGIYNGTATGTTIVDGKVNNGRSFDGTDDYITVPSGFSNFTKGLTISLWANPTSNSNWGRFVDFGEPSGSAFSNIILNRFSTSNDLEMSIGNGSTDPYIIAPNGIINNEWHLYTATVSESGMGRLYRDGILLSEGQLAVPTNVSRISNYIGRSNYPGDSLYQGYMDEVKIYNRALSPGEIFDDYALSKGIFDRKNDGLVSYWNMDETSGTSVKDSIGINNGTATGTTIVDGKVNKGRSFNGTSDYVVIPSSTTLNLSTTDFTLEAWINTSKVTAFGEIIGKGINTDYEIMVTDTGKIRFLVGDGGSIKEFDSTTTLQVGKWYHIVGVKTGSNTTGKIYINGMLDSTSTSFGDTATGNSSNSLLIGARSTGTPQLYFTGIIDEAKIYNRALSATEIAIEYGESIDRHSTPQSSYINYQIQQGNISNKISLPIYIAGDELGEYISTTIGESAYANYQPDANTVGLWHLDEIDGNGPFIKDSSGNSNNGIVVGEIYTPDGKISGAGNFDGTSYVSLGNPSQLQITGSETIDMWVYPMSFSYRMNPLDKAFGGEGAITQEPDGTISYYYGTCGGTCEPYEGISSNIALKSHKWNHIAIVRDLVNMKVNIYINGVLGNSKTVSMSAASVSPWPVYIGKGYAGAPYIGNIDEVRISNIVRTPEEIRQAYEVGLRTHNVEIEFGAKLDNSNPIASSTDKSFSINGIAKGMLKMGSNIYAGEKIIVREQKDTGEYIAQGIVNSINEDTGAVTVSSWDTVSTFPSTGFSSNADVFKWQKEYIPVKDRTLDTHLDQAKLLTLRVDNAYGGRNVWIDNLTSDEYVTPSPQDIINLGKSYRFFQYKAVLMSTDPDTSPIISQIQLDYTPIPPMNRIMRHGKWFLSGTKQPFWWAK